MKFQFVTILSCVGLFACASDINPSDVEQVSEGIVNGNTVSLAEQRAKGLATLPGCSAILLSNSWVLTAAHCTNNGPGTTNTVSYPASSGLTSIVSDQAYNFGNLWLGSTSPDLTLLHLSSPFVVNGSTTGYQMAYETSAGSSLNGTVLAEYGQGYNTAGSTGTGYGTWRAGDMTVNSSSFGSLNFLPNSSGQIANHGDSGGPFLRWVGGVPRVSGVASWGSETATTTSASYAVSVGDYSAWIAAVFQTSWNANLSAQFIDIRRAELDGTGLGFTDINSVSWAGAARAASRVCYARNFAGGHFTGHQAGTGSSALKGMDCKGSGTAYYDISNTTMSGTPEGFTDVNTVPWARSNRVAKYLCAAQGKTRGGFFTGNQTNSGGVNVSFGLICSNTSSTVFSASAADLTATGWTVGNLNSASWAQAQRAATGYCTSRGYVGGFMNGVQSSASGPYGVVCEN